MNPSGSYEWSKRTEKSRRETNNSYEKAKEKLNRKDTQKYSKQ